MTMMPPALGDAGEAITSVPRGQQRVASPASLTVNCARIRAQQRNRVYAIKGQQRADRACESYLAGLFGYHPALAEAERKKLFAKAAALRKAIERDKGLDKFDPSLVREVRDLVLTTAMAREQYDKIRLEAEHDMIARAATLPGAEWFASIPGATLRGLAVIVGEAGNLSGYATHSKLWRRFGLAPFKGRALSAWRCKYAGTLTKAEWEEAGYNPHRLAQLYGVVTFPLVTKKAQSVYGLVYAQAKARYDQRVIATAALPLDDKAKWTPARAARAAERYMVKRLVRDLWNAWRRAAFCLPSGHFRSALLHAAE